MLLFLKFSLFSKSKILMSFFSALISSSGEIQIDNDYELESMYVQSI